MNKKPLSRRASRIHPSATLKIDAKFKRMLSEGIDVVGFAADGCILRAWQDEQREILEENYQDKEYGVAVIKDTPLSDEIERAVKDLSEAGVMDKIVERWY